MANFECFVQQYPLIFNNSDIPDSWKPLLGSVFSCSQCPTVFDQMLLGNPLDNIALALKDDFDWFPKSDTLWSFTKLCRPEDVKVVIVGQDPSDASATGLAFSKDVGEGIYQSTETILEEVRNDIGEHNLRPFPEDYGNLDYWAKQGVLLLNSALTKSPHKSHLEIGWKTIVAELIKQLQQINKNIVFVFWGWHAMLLSHNVEYDDWNKLVTGHPSKNNEKNDFLGCRHFSNANRRLIKYGIEPIDWCPLPPKNIS
ncbi:uracil-DNA glycosylase 1-like [Diabrotica virgifera virgifera]|uniref:Uncharacterized protein LOC114347540 n=1 Tax=Diabrotica virgifera virgifera TaxID=50390 RepID=A0A6P7GWA4_DIAVI|nr:uracil-DNA glycosylase 1-like [Diabrotica virgifera virgifera]